MKRALFVLLVVLAFSTTMFGTASAAVTSLSLDGKATLSSATAVVASGTISCDAGETRTVAVNIFQSSGKVNTAGSGLSADITCTGQSQTWSAVVTVMVGAEFKKGPATALFVVPGGEGVGFPSQVQRIKISN